MTQHDYKNWDQDEEDRYNVREILKCFKRNKSENTLSVIVISCMRDYFVFVIISS